MNLKQVSMAVAACVVASAQAQPSYPSQPIKLIVPFTAGSSSDVTARAVAQKLTVQLDQPVVVENKPGASGGIGMRAVALSKPDGYTLVVGSGSSTVVPSIISKVVMFDLFTDFTPVATMANTPLLLTVNANSPFTSVADLVAAAKKAPDTLTYGNSAGLYRIAMESLNDQANIKILGIPFKGPSQAATELLGGRLSVNPNALGSVGPMLESKSIRALAVLGSNRTASLPEVPTMLELGYKGFEFNGWLGILAPAGTPQPIVDRLYKEIAIAVKSPDLLALYKSLGMEPTVLSPQAYANEMKKDMAKYRAVAEKAGIERQ